MRNCKAPRPDTLTEEGARSKKRPRDNGDNWLCPECGNSNFPNRVVCNMKKCGAPKPDSDDKRLKADLGEEFDGVTIAQN